VRLRWDEATERFRDELRAWLDEHAPPEELRQSEPALSAAHYPSWARPWQNLLFDEGLLIPGLGPEYGGRNLGPVEQLIYYEEFTSRQIPRSTNWTGVSIIVPSIIDFGTPEQIERFALPALHAETSWCLGMSEPNAGSDLAGLQTKAVPHGDTFVVNGQKIWTSGAHHADWCLCFVRTDPTAAKHKGISCLLIDMKTPGIEVRPIEEITGGDVHDLNEVFFTDVEVPAENLLGPLHGGWPLTQGSLAHERAILWIENCFFVNDALDHLMGLIRERGIGDDPKVRDAVASKYIDAWALQCMGYRGFAKYVAGKATPEHSILKLFSSEVFQQTYLIGAETVGPEALDMEGVTVRADNRRFTGNWNLSWLSSFAATIPGGTSEIQRNIVAERVLGLPRR
jgi:alkylation response protein AidB-like acyl-CoA dehydrogenase